VTLVDTAGIRETDGLVEREGIRRAEARAASADLVLWLEDASQPVTAPALPGAVRVATKIDLIDSGAERSSDVAVSSTSGAGVNELIALIASRILAELRAVESPLITRSRHRSAVQAAAASLAHARLLESGPLEVRAEDLRIASDALARITGRIDVEDLLDVIFRDFCVGK
jgi:tRNA modification GTPase